MYSPKAVIRYRAPQRMPSHKPITTYKSNMRLYSSDGQSYPAYWMHYPHRMPAAESGYPGRGMELRDRLAGGRLLRELEPYNMAEGPVRRNLDKIGGGHLLRDLKERAPGYPLPRSEWAEHRWLGLTRLPDGNITIYLLIFDLSGRRAGVFPSSSGHCLYYSYFLGFLILTFIMYPCIVWLKNSGQRS